MSKVMSIIPMFLFDHALNTACLVLNVYSIYAISRDWLHG